MTTPRYFIETSLCRHAIFGHDAVRKKISSVINGKRRSSSFFVLMEYKRSFLCNLIEFYFVLKSVDTLAEAIQIWNEQFKIRKLKDINLAIAALLDSGGNDYTKEIALVKWKTLVIDAYAKFFLLINNTFVENQTRCVLGKKILFESERIPTEQNLRDFFEFFQEDHADSCSIKRFTKKHAKTITHVVEEEIEGQNTEQLKKVLASPEQNSCFRCCTIADTILVLEVPKSHVVLTFDRGISELCRIFDREFTLLPSALSVVAQQRSLGGV